MRYERQSAFHIAFYLFDESCIIKNLEFSKVVSIQQIKHKNHQRILMLNKLTLFIAVIIVLFASGCNIVKKKDDTPVLLKTEDATKEEILAEINRFAKLTSMRAKIDLKFEDNSYAQLGNKEVYITVPGEIVVQRPASILLKVQAPVFNSDIAQMTSNGASFRVAILQDGGDGKNKKFLKGSNGADYTRLQKNLESIEVTGTDKDKTLKKNVNAFANLRPQHFTDAILMRPVDPSDVYVQSTISIEETDSSQQKKSKLLRVIRGYYLLDEIGKSTDGNFKVMRRFWFDRVGGIRLARQQVFDPKGEIESDIVYGNVGSLGTGEDYKNLPIRIQLTRPKEKYTMKLTYQSPENISLGKTYKQEAFELVNSWGLEEVDLDQKLSESLEKISAKVQ